MKLLYDHSTHSLITPTGATFATIDPNVTAREGQWVADEIERAAEMDGKIDDLETDLERSREETSDAETEASATISSIINKIDGLFIDMDDRFTVEEAAAAINAILEPHR